MQNSSPPTTTTASSSFDVQKLLDNPVDVIQDFYSSQSANEMPKVSDLEFWINPMACDRCNP